ncbi:hypothetical protein cand_006760 [Cryptosporidium andersoni]|uniref:Uncharacterized protein n=1 Tax=Cryptosporidium andersoni TaxID=117008 RepID=A0A1J4MQ13_9CRYT|nr:hypothetical protein cand_006760 [Cryptosporidium andersoni]
MIIIICIICTLIISCKSKYVNKVIEFNESNFEAFITDFSCGIGVCNVKIRARRIANYASITSPNPSLPPIVHTDKLGSLDLVVFIDHDWRASTSYCSNIANAKINNKFLITPHWSEWITIQVEQVISPHTWFFTMVDCSKKNIEIIKNSKLGTSPEYIKKPTISRSRQNQTNFLYIQIEGFFYQPNGSHLPYELVSLPCLLIFEILCYICIFMVLFIKTIALDKSAKIYHPLILWITATLVINAIACIIESLYIFKFKETGISNSNVLLASRILNLICNVGIYYLLIAIISGYSLLVYREKDKYYKPSIKLISFIFFIYILQFIFLKINKFRNFTCNTYTILSYIVINTDDTCNCACKIISLLKIIHAVIFEYIWKKNEKLFITNNLSKILDKLRIIGHLYILAYPSSCLISILWIKYHEKEIVTNLVTFIIQIITYLSLIYIFSSRKSSYFKHSYLSCSIIPTREDLLIHTNLAKQMLTRSSSEFD